MNKEKSYRLINEMLSPTGHVISFGEIFKQYKDTRIYVSSKGWQMSEEACLNKDWFEEVVEGFGIEMPSGAMQFLKAAGEYWHDGEGEYYRLPFWYRFIKNNVAVAYTLEQFENLPSRKEWNKNNEAKEDFKWTDELVRDCHEYINQDTAGVLTPYGVMKNIQYFKEKWLERNTVQPLDSSLRQNPLTEEECDAPKALTEERVGDLIIKMQSQPLEWFTEEKIFLLTEVDSLRKELKVTEVLLNDMQRLLDEIPECPVHGKCIPHALDWIKERKNIDTPKEYKIIRWRLFNGYFSDKKTVAPCHIYTVLRLSDNTTWSVGEETQYGVIKKIEEQEHASLVFYVGVNDYPLFIYEAKKK